MTGTADVRAFYAALRIELPTWTPRNATVRCFANPDAHAHEDRTPSCSVSLEHGAWRCWACDARGGPYDAAIALGHTRASAIDLMVEHCLIERRKQSAAREHPYAVAKRLAAVKHGSSRSVLSVTDADVAEWHAALCSQNGDQWRERLTRQRLWHLSVVPELELGYDGSRITIPIRNGNGELRGVLRYLPGSAAQKMLAVPGTRLGLIPDPAREPSHQVLLVEGPPDMIAARSRGWPAIAVPGVHAWQPEWANLLNGRDVTILMDCDSAGRQAAQRIAADLTHLALVRVMDLAPARTDGFDLTKWLLTQSRPRSATCTASSSSRPTITL